MASTKIYIGIWVSMLLFCACAEKKKSLSSTSEETQISLEQDSPELQSILDSAKVKGAIVLYDLQKDAYYSNDFDWAKTQRLPASTFKIANSIIALETKVVENDSTLFEWDGASRGMKIWERDLIFREAFHLSCVPCYQEVARKIGVERMKEYLTKLEYGAMQVDKSNIDLFWLEGTSGISQLEQIDFLKRFYRSKLPISKRTENIMKGLMVMTKKEHYILSGKTGLALRGGQSNGWFVGFVETQGKTYFFATNIEPSNGLTMQEFIPVRKEVTMRALRAMEILE